MPKVRSINGIVPMATIAMLSDPRYLSSSDNNLGLFMGREYMKTDTIYEGFQIYRYKRMRYMLERAIVLDNERSH